MEIRIEDTPIAVFDNVTYEIVAPGGNVTLFPTNVASSGEVVGQDCATGVTVTEIRAELLGENATTVERVKHADIVSFTCLKAFAFDQRFERKDAHDLIYCIEHAPVGLDTVVAAFGQALAGKHAAVIREAQDVLRRRFADDEATEGYRKDGPVSVAKFELGEGQDPELREARVLRQRQPSDLIDRLLAGIG